MSLGSLLLRSLAWYWRTHLWVVLGAACTTAVLVGALAVGDSVRGSLRRQAEARIGRVDAALVHGERSFGADLAARVGAGLGRGVAAPVLHLRATASVGGGAARAGVVEVYGVDERFFALAPAATGRALQADEARVNAALAAHLGVQPGDSILVRVERPSALPRDAVMATVEDAVFALRMTVGGILGDAELGRFSLRASPVPPFNVFVALPWLQRQLDLEGRANLLLVGGVAADGDAVERAGAVLADTWQLDDAELSLLVPDGAAHCELTSRRLFLERPVADAIERAAPDALGVLTYFVNELRHGERAVPYSMVSAVGVLAATSAGSDPVRLAEQVVPRDLPDDGIVLHSWCAERLGASAGTVLDLEYFVMGPQLDLRTASRSLRVHSIVPMAGLAADPTLMPPFPGLAGAESCRDWEPGVAVELERLGDEDQRYWEEHRGTPKAFVGLRAGQAMWGSRFGELTAVRAPGDAVAGLRQRLRQELDPKSVGLLFRDVRGPALAGGTSATDFGGLFLGLSMFLLIAALLLTSLLFVFGVEQRSAEVGTLLAVGFRPAGVRRLILGEGLVLAGLGGVLGAGLGLLYTRAVLLGLATFWRDAVGPTSLQLEAHGVTVLGGALGGIVAAVAGMVLALRRAFERPATELLQGRPGSLAPARRSRAAWLVSVAAPLAAVVLIATTGSGSAAAAGAFFGAGALLLLGALAACRLLLARVAGAERGLRSVAALGVRNSGRRLGRSLTAAACLASGTFLVVGVQAHRLEAPKDPTVRASGTGGFALFGRSALPVLRDLGSAAGRDAYGLGDGLLGEVDVVPLRVREGDEASCLNLSLPQQPRLWGVRPAELADRGAFRFAAWLPPESGGEIAHPWQLLDADYGPDVVPAVGDAASITWALHKKVGDTLDFADELGRPFRVRIVGAVADSILQGSLVISQQRFERRYPSTSGFSAFLIDAPVAQRERVAAGLTRAFEDLGLEVTTTAGRLQSFRAVQNTYLLIFQALGGLGLLLGTAGLGMIVLRNALERRSELALVSAVGFPAREVRKLVWSEHGLVLALGLGSGVLAALVAVIPSVAGGEMPWLPMLVLVAAVAVCGWASVRVASVLATRGPLWEALRSE